MTSEYADIEVDDPEIGYSGVSALKMKRADRVKVIAACMPLLLGVKGIKSGHMHPDREQLIWGDDVMFRLMCEQDRR